ncbi:hypothetical protein EDC01DRAFT_339910 [Geopyxis carbonaria]|nr:hypothetical protein EDC01DRAFT_339910 [Geopyxis carbonaria]
MVLLRCAEVRRCPEKWWWEDGWVVCLGVSCWNCQCCTRYHSGLAMCAAQESDLLSHLFCCSLLFSSLLFLYVNLTQRTQSYHFKLQHIPIIGVLRPTIQHRFMLDSPPVRRFMKLFEPSEPRFASPFQSSEHGDSAVHVPAVHTLESSSLTHLVLVLRLLSYDRVLSAYLFTALQC